ncbi:hypothetical protein A3G67_00980 [Candidatus Roizmanbacteria bacterium RIFCSPLOWO2_12_FULL_40_12]|uniref:Haloacid dehalogenase n=1 Tax=Candidatus Roizmanbacteria bacterium RIFCSPLOWO2_01_FULL_40_42 TaxID=1802066 RepID=A0A1F7J1Y9_9BACT|nr:MAG: hypothetical protein A3C31_04175 [Candidatus Roizmanbacteria bacterium RIFCSPHIGHO2_02_FULL_40_53]OGK29735.1 MAG: hypothetical protein A2W49_04725 [Candidatus Roizmanbacteria bacterium RIFCSPHIGHO2_12_41_18]OGK49624.1 MAG: hypothetical protein A3B50_04190 [Candidatus Roizmanbacteria bacterium RIFCSPLOWO2_01_FULL_40_42]OGK60307.1 MAG: hypothetical protein A3G67_00980 [Candidatus Roizmanbacteria bacterium RIFCSPLOWO2_12_FULL_40_12]
MQEVREKTPEVNKIPWSKSVWFFDIDDTIIDTAGTSGTASDGIKKVFEARFTSEQALQVQTNFNQLFDLMLSGYRVKAEEDWQNVPGGKSAFDNLVEKIETSQKRVKEKYGGVKKWSREVFIKLAADQAGVRVAPELVHEAADAYWLTLTEQTTVFPQVLDLIQEIQKHNRPIYLITSSDARLKMDSDGQFDYDPTYSEGLKRERIELLREKGVTFNAVSIGDPEDKPHMDFFQKGVKKAEEDLGHPIDLSNSLMFGDSFGGDLQVPKEQLGFGLVVLFQKGNEKTEIVDNRQIDTGDVSSVLQYMDVA